MSTLQIFFLTIFAIAIEAQINNSTDCSYDFTTSTGSFTSPSYSNPHQGPNSESCLWRITASPDERIVLNITDIDIEKVAECALGYLEVRDGHWIESPLLGRYCGSGKLNLIESTGNKMYISYVYDDRQNHRGFAAKYEGMCGGDIFVANQSQLTSPGYPQPYPLEKECVWRIEVHENRKAALRFSFFDVEEEAECLTDYLEVREGWSEDSTLVGRYCNWKLPTDILSDTNSLYIKFVSDSSVQRGGFSATILNDEDECLTDEHQCQQICINTIGSYKCACEPGFELKENERDCQVSCGGTLDAISGTIETPTSSNVTYPLNRTCIWNIVASPQYQVTINFTRFDVGEDDGCTNDRVQIFNNVTDFLDTESTFCNNATSNSTLLLEDTFCGNSLPGTFYSQSNIVKIVLDSYNSTGSGFALDYSVARDGCSMNNGNCLHECRNVSGTTECLCNHGFVSDDGGRNCIDETGCAFEFSSSSRNLYSPGNGSGYPPNKTCWWDITSTPGHWIVLDFQSFELETRCIYDNVTVYDSSSKINQLGSFCGNTTPPAITSSRNTLYVTFSSDYSNQYKGFQAKYSTICSGTLEADSTEQYIYSHTNFSSSIYDFNTDCYWNITARDNYVISASFLIFDIEKSNSCSKDYVEVFDGANSTKSSFGKYCGNEPPPRFCSISNSLMIHFHSDDTISRPGFSLVYQAIKDSKN